MRLGRTKPLLYRSDLSQRRISLFLSLRPRLKVNFLSVDNCRPRRVVQLRSLCEPQQHEPPPHTPCFSTARGSRRKFPAGRTNCHRSLKMILAPCIHVATARERLCPPFCVYSRCEAFLRLAVFTHRPHNGDNIIIASRGKSRIVVYIFGYSG